MHCKKKKNSWANIKYKYKKKKQASADFLVLSVQFV